MFFFTVDNMATNLGDKWLERLQMSKGDDKWSEQVKRKQYKNSDNTPKINYSNSPRMPSECNWFIVMFDSSFGRI